MAIDEYFIILLVILVAANFSQFFYLYRVHKLIKKADEDLKSSTNQMTDSINNSMQKMQNSMSLLGEQVNQTFKSSTNQMTYSVNEMSKKIDASVLQLNYQITKTFQESLPAALEEFRMRQLSQMATLYLDESTIPISIRLVSDDIFNENRNDKSGVNWYKNLLNEVLCCTNLTTLHKIFDFIVI